MKKAAIALLITISVISLSACGKKDESQDNIKKDNEVIVETDKKEDEQEKMEPETSPIKDNIVEEEIKTEITEEQAVNNEDIDESNLYKSTIILDDLYNAKQQNVLFSPLSLNMALGMLNSGATDSTRDAIDTYLGTNNFDEIANTIMEEYYNEEEMISVQDEVYNEALSKIKSYGIEDKKAENIAKYIVSLSGLDAEGFKYEEEYEVFVNSMYEDDFEEFYNWYSTLDEYIYNNIYKDTSSFNVANSVWVEKTREITKVFRDKIKDTYKASVDNIDVNDPKGSADKVNEWCNDKTHGLIPEIISESNIKYDTSAILVNTVYFNSNWVEDWYEKDLTFNNIDNTTSEITGIRNEVNRYYASDEATAFGMFYKNRFEFIGILPKKEGDFNVSDIDIEQLIKNDRTDLYDEIYAEMPKLKFDTDTYADNGENVLNSSLKKLGLNEIFTQNAHLENIVVLNPDEVTYVSDIIQKCTIDLDEYGTEASAATAIMIETCGAVAPIQEPKIAEVILNRPYIFLIRDTKTNQIAFIGKVVIAE